MLALENRKEPQALQYLYRLLDIANKGHLNVFDLNFFFRVMYHVYRGIVYAVYLLDVLGESHTAQLLLDHYCTRIFLWVMVLCQYLWYISTYITYDIQNYSWLFLGIWNIIMYSGIQGFRPPCKPYSLQLPITFGYVQYMKRQIGAIFLTHISDHLRNIIRNINKFPNESFTYMHVGHPVIVAIQ